MTAQSPLHKYVHDRFREVFGEPDTILGSDDHWSLRPSPDQPSINLLANGTADTPAVWVFDPHVKNDGVLHRGIKKESDVDEFIELIHKRIEQAAKKGVR